VCKARSRLRHRHTHTHTLGVKSLELGEKWSFTSPCLESCGCGDMSFRVLGVFMVAGQ
jgi:hypothetical protein